MSTNESMEHVEKKELDSMAEGTRSGRYFEPLVDIFETEDGLTLQADMPGISDTDIDIDLREGVLTILGKQPERGEESGREHVEFEYGNYLRRFTVTDQVDQDKISAKISDGVLTVVLPKAEKAKPRTIPVTTG